MTNKKEKTLLLLLDAGHDGDYSLYAIVPNDLEGYSKLVDYSKATQHRYYELSDQEKQDFFNSQKENSLKDIAGYQRYVAQQHLKISKRIEERIKDSAAALNSGKITIQQIRDSINKDIPTFSHEDWANDQAKRYSRSTADHPIYSILGNIEVKDLNEIPSQVNVVEEGITKILTIDFVA